MQQTDIADVGTLIADPPRRLRVEVVDALFAQKHNIHSIAAQAGALGLHKSHWFKIRAGVVEPKTNVIADAAEFLDSTVGAIWGRPE